MVCCFTSTCLSLPLAYFQVGLNDLLSGWLTITSDILDTSLGYFTTVHTFNVAVLILGFVLAAFYLLLCIPPYMRLIKEEASQVMLLFFFNF